MKKNNFFPLRSIVGSSVAIKTIVPHSGRPKDFEIVCIPDLQIGGNPPQALAGTFEPQVAPHGNLYSKFLPDIITGGTRYTPAGGMATLPPPQSNLPFSSLFPVLEALDSPSDLPFDPSDPVGAIFGFKTKGFDNYTIHINGNAHPAQPPFASNTEGDFVFDIILEQEALIGGICFSGFPYITSRLEPGTGMTLGNFGLPREIRLIPMAPVNRKANAPDEYQGFHRSQFIDAEFEYSRQEIISHSGLNYLCIDPIKTNHFKLILTDLPFILREIDIDNSPTSASGNVVLRSTGFKGFALPYLYFFEYKESTHKNARLHSGILGVRSESLPINKDGKPDLLKLAFPEYEFFLPQQEDEDGYYAVYTAHSMSGQRRQFYLGLPQFAGGRKGNQEIFISDLLQPEEKVTIFLQQGEEYERCVAGLKLLLPMLPNDSGTEKLVEQLMQLVGEPVDGDEQLTPDERTRAEELLAYLLGVPDEVNFCERVSIRVYEIDPPEGVSPASIDLSTKYATLLANVRVDDFADVVLDYFLKGILFKKVSAATYFALEITNRGEEAGQVAIHSMHLVRSAHISVQPRPAKTQQVQTLHYRIIGPELADDFSRLGNEGFNFSIDRVVAGQTKNTLYSAVSLLDLLHTGGAKIQSNGRRRAVEFEASVVYGEEYGGTNFERRRTDSRIVDSWRRNETGDGVAWEGDAAYAPSGLPSSAGDSPFSSFSSQEVRTHTKLLFPDFSLPEWASAAIFANGMAISFQGGDILNAILTGNSSSLLLPTYDFRQHAHKHELIRNFEKFWKGVNQSDLIVRGLLSVNQSPYGMLPSSAQSLDNLLTLFAGDVAAPDILNLVIGGGVSMGSLLGMVFPPAQLLPVISLLNGLNAGISVQPGGLGVSFGNGVPNLLPAVSQSATHGSQGNITKQASNTPYAYSQMLMRGADQAEAVSYVEEGANSRVIARDLVPDNYPNADSLNKQRIRGAEIMWQGEIQDIITGSIPLNFVLPATATKMNVRTSDDALRVRFNSGFSPSIEVDFWFELTEEVIRDDY